jgi:hypothetical protein
MDTERQVMQDYLDALVKRTDFPSYFTERVRRDPAHGPGCPSALFSGL